MNNIQFYSDRIERCEADMREKLKSIADNLQATANSMSYRLDGDFSYQDILYLAKDILQTLESQYPRIAVLDAQIEAYKEALDLINYEKSKEEK